MVTQNKIPKSRISIITIALLTVGLSCLCLPGNIISTNTPDTNSSPTPTLVLPTNTKIPPANTNKLGTEGPWLLMQTGQGLWAANPDGSAVTQLSDEDYWHADLADAIQPRGNLIAFISPGSYDFHHMALNLLSLPDGKVTKITDLTTPETEAYTELNPGDPGFAALRAIAEQRSLAWSPDGTRLAFVGLMDGPSAEIYLYETASGHIQRVSRDDAQNFRPSWSPDGKSLLYFGTDSFGTGAGYNTSGVWSARGDGTNVTWLYVPKGGAEELVGWLDNTTAVLATWTAVCGSERLRLFDIVSTKTVMLEEECFISATANSWQHGAVLFANSSGLHLFTADDRELVPVSQEPVGRIDPWNLEDSLFTVRFKNGDIATFGSFGSGLAEYEHQVSPVNAPIRDHDVAAYGAIWGWTSMDDNQPGAWISGPGMEKGQIFEGKATLPIWDSDNNLLFFAPEGDGYSIYRTTFDTFYQDLSVVGFISAKNVQSVTWLGFR